MDLELDLYMKGEYGTDDEWCQLSFLWIDLVSVATCNLLPGPILE